MRKKKAVPEVPETVLRSTERSPLFWLLYEHHALLASRWEVQRADWRAVCAWAETQQAWDKTGRTPTPGTAQKTWQRVCLQHAREKAQREAQRRPSLIPTPRQTLPPAVVAPTRAEVPKTPQSDVEERMALMKAKINRRSGRLA